jgi:FkbM family methyltransferase
MFRIKRLIAIFSTFRNALSVVIDKVVPGRLRMLTLWGGETFEVDNVNNNLGTILEVFHLEEYQDARTIAHHNPTIIDIGANIGTFSVWISSQFPRATIYAFEPEQKNFSLLSKNILHNNRVTQIYAYREAVCGTKGKRLLSVAGESSGKNSLAYDTGTGTTATVSCTTLSDIFRAHNIERCDCLKIDCEGAEYELLYATPSEVLARVSMIIFEAHQVQGHTVKALSLFLKNHGFTVTPSPDFESMYTARRTT